ncbi:MAG: helix-turn-helix transcriptional regulator [Cyanothece sp. SIO1E1]|nr:helix-turn-helix transcriptional regulator [Cyanothece sp. SIO1E1]
MYSSISTPLDSTALEANFQAQQSGLPEYILQSTIAYIHEHLDQELRLAGIAKVAGISQYYFARLFKQSTGIAPHQYVIQQRVKRAKQLLEQRGLQIADIALECGFTSQSQLNKHFRVLTGTTPKAYRKQRDLSKIK